MNEHHTPHGIRWFHVGNEFNLSNMRQELSDMTDVLLGREDPPIDVGVLTLMEVAEAFHARASEMEMAIHRAEADGTILKGTRAYKFRTGELRTFIEMTKRTIDLGSRRVTAMQMELQQKEGW